MVSSNGKLLLLEDWTVPRDATPNLQSLHLGSLQSDIRTDLPGAVRPPQAISIPVQASAMSTTTSKFTTMYLCRFRSQRSRRLRGRVIPLRPVLPSPSGQHCDAGRVFKNLLLSEKPKAEAIPELEVLFDEMAAAGSECSC